MDLSVLSMEGKVQSTSFCGGQRPHSSQLSQYCCPLPWGTEHQAHAGIWEVWSLLPPSPSEGRGTSAWLFQVSHISSCCAPRMCSRPPSRSMSMREESIDYVVRIDSVCWQCTWQDPYTQALICGFNNLTPGNPLQGTIPCSQPHLAATTRLG